MKLFSAIIVILCVVASACGGDTPTSPTSSTVSPQVTPAPSPTPTPAPAPGGQLTLTPGSAIMSVGQTLTFVASGADGKNYSLTAGPSWILKYDLVGTNSIRVTMVGRDADYAWVMVSGYDPSTGVVEKKVTIGLK